MTMLLIDDRNAFGGYRVRFFDIHPPHDERRSLEVENACTHSCVTVVVLILTRNDESPPDDRKYRGSRFIESRDGSRQT